MATSAASTSAVASEPRRARKHAIAVNAKVRPTHFRVPQGSTNRSSAIPTATAVTMQTNGADHEPRWGFVAARSCLDSRAACWRAGRRQRQLFELRLPEIESDEFRPRASSRARVA